MTDKEIYLYVLGYDQAARIGQLYAYKIQLNKFGAAHYSPTVLADAERRDAKVPNKPDIAKLVKEHAEHIKYRNKATKMVAK